jgi:hypothetical protein
MNYSEDINRILESKSVSWKIKNKLRSGKNCTTCTYGNEGWCFYTMNNPPYDHQPDYFNHLMICKKYKGENGEKSED